METQMKSEFEVLRQALVQQDGGEEVLTAAAILNERLDMLKRTSPLFEAVSFSPEVEAIMAEQLTAVAN
ncbi:MAG: hypothetical protein ACYSOF_08950 [Planctomycetota bacterium]|jgi:hypothetical protein